MAAAAAAALGSGILDSESERSVPACGSGSSSRFVWLQCGQTHSLDLISNQYFKAKVERNAEASLLTELLISSFPQQDIQLSQHRRQLVPLTERTPAAR